MAVDAQILSFLTNRAHLADDYGNKLLKLSSSHLGQGDLGTVRNALDTLRLETRLGGLAHLPDLEQAACREVRPRNCAASMTRVTAHPEFTKWCAW